MEELGADIAKIAVMPRSARDVLTFSFSHRQGQPEVPCPARSSPCP
ncbi:MAG: type I 3-dehydroquinate dehydratase [Enterocloster clostridioformis]